MTQGNRIAGGLIDRTQTLNFNWNGKNLQGHPGDTLASALLANGERFVARSFKYHRPRGLFSAGSEEPSALVQLRRGAAQAHVGHEVNVLLVPVVVIRCNVTVVTLEGCAWRVGEGVRASHRGSRQ